MSELTLSSELLQISPEVQEALNSKKTDCCPRVNHYFSWYAISAECPDRY